MGPFCRLCNGPAPQDAAICPDCAVAQGKEIVAGVPCNEIVGDGMSYGYGWHKGRRCRVLDIQPDIERGYLCAIRYCEESGK